MQVSYRHVYDSVVEYSTLEGYILCQTASQGGPLARRRDEDARGLYAWSDECLRPGYH